jgi:hypothetical protein
VHARCQSANVNKKGLHFDAGIVQETGACRRLRRHRGRRFSCGRKGDLDAPGTYEGQTMDKATGTVKTKPLVREDKPFVLDPLL